MEATEPEEPFRRAYHRCRAFERARRAKHFDLPQTVQMNAVVGDARLCELRVTISDEAVDERLVRSAVEMCGIGWEECVVVRERAILAV
jgi:hypothetical protein